MSAFWSSPTEWGAPREYSYTPRDGQAITGVVVGETQTLSDTVLRIQVTTGANVGKEVAIPSGDIISKTPVSGVSTTIWQWRWLITSACAAGLGIIILVIWFGIVWWKVAAASIAPLILSIALPTDGLRVMIPFAAAVIGLSAITATDKGEAGEWFGVTWTFSKQILPLLFFGVLIAGFLLGRVGHEGIIPSRYVQMLVGGTPDTFLGATGLGGGGWESPIRALWPLWTNFFAALFGAFMYFATLTEMPIVQGLIDSGIESIPTQIFYDPTGKELFRHLGAIPKEEILAKWKELGFTFSETTNP